MTNTTRSAFNRVSDKTQNITAAPPAPVPVNDTEDEVKVADIEVVTISKAEYVSLLDAKKKLDDLQNVLNK